MISLLQTADAVVVAEQTRMGLWQLFMSGGWLMWVLLILGGLTIFIFVERFMAIRKASEFDMNFMNRIRDYISDGKIHTAVNLCKKTDTPIARMIEKGIERIGRPMSDVQTAIENVANLEVSKLENGSLREAANRGYSRKEDAKLCRILFLSPRISRRTTGSSAGS